MSGDAEERAPLPSVAQRAVEIYREQFGAAADEPLAVGWAPGRMNIIGEHTDYNEGYVLPAAIDRLVALAGRAADEPFATLYSAHHQAWARVRIDSEPGDVEDAGAIPLWARYVLATWRQLALVGAAAPVQGMSAVLVGDVPLGGGLSSSAALEVASAMFAQALGGPALPPMEMARACQRAEHEGVGVRVGIMDQAASCLGQPQRAILLDCRTLDYSYVAAQTPEAAWLVFDTGVPHTLAASEYNTRRGQCEAAVARLAPTLQGEQAGRSVRALRDIRAQDLIRHGAVLDETLLRRARHVVMENERTLRAADALRVGDVEALGALLNASHLSLRDDYAVSCRELDVAVEIAQATPGALGARMMGAGFGGSILALVRQDALDTLISRLGELYPRKTGKTGSALICAITGQTGASGPRSFA